MTEKTAESRQDMLLWKYMKKYISKNTQKIKAVNRFWGNAARLEHINVRNKKKGKKR